MYKLCVTAIAALLLAVCLTGCSKAIMPRRENTTDTIDTLRIEKLISYAYWMARNEMCKKKSSPAQYRSYIEALIADGKIRVGLGIGTEDLGRVAVPEEQGARTCREVYMLYGKKVLVEGRLIVTRDEFRTALYECDVIFVTSHSRFGAGPVFLRDGKAQPYRMQKKNDYEIVMPESEVSGYEGKVKRSFYDPVRGKNYTVFEPDSSDLDKSNPLHGYQMIVLSTCTSRKHFLDDIAQFRGYYPTTGIFTTRPCCMDTGMEVFMRFLSEIFQGNALEAVVAGMNEEYKAVALRKVKMKIPPWQVIDNLYAIGINTVQ